METFKPTISKPVNQQSKNLEKNFKSTIQKNNIKLDEIEELLTEKEQSLKKKIFSLPKMEALVFSDPKLTNAYNEMANNGSERYGYHFNETLMNILFNDFILNSSKYLEKYKQAIPTKKKRRDKSGIEQLKKSGEKKMKKNNQNEETTLNVEETTSAGSAGGNSSYVGYAGPAAWSKSGQPAMRKPIWVGGALISESEYLTNPTEFHKMFDNLNEQNDIDFIQKNSEAYGSLNNMNKDNLNIIKKDIEIKHLDEKSVSKSQQRFMGMVRAVQKGDINPSEVGEKVKKVAKNMKPKDVEDFASTKHKKLPEKIDENLLSIEDTYFDEIKNGNSEENAAEIVLDILTGGKFKIWAGEKINQFIKKIIKHMRTKINENMNETEDITKVIFLVNERDEDPDLFAYFPEENFDREGILKTGYAHIGQHSAVDPRYAKESRLATPEEYNDLKNELESIGYNLEIVTEINEESMIEPNPSSISFKPTPLDQSSMERGLNSGGGSMMNEDNESDIKKNNVPLYHQIQIAKKTLKMTDSGAAIMGGMTKEEARNLLKKHNIKVREDENFDMMNEELNSYSLLIKNLKMLGEDKKPSTLVMKDRLGSENQKNFKKDLQHSGTKEIIDVEKELQWKDQQTDVKDPQKLTADLEKNELKNTKGESFKNVGDSTNNEGDEIPKRNLTNKEQDEVNMYRLGMQDLVYDNEPGKRFEDRMKNDMGEELYKQKLEKFKFRAEAPLYNKDTQPIEQGIKKNQYNKDISGWNNRKGIKESIITGKYINELGKKELIHFSLNEVYKSNNKNNDDYKQLDFTGMKISLNENINKFILNHVFFTDGKKVYMKKGFIKEHNDQTIVENYDKMKHLIGYKPKEYVDTKKIILNKKI